MELHVQVKGKREPIIFKGDRIDVLDFEMQGQKFKQIRYFRKGFSKSEYIESNLIVRMKEIKKSH
ncbi:MAG: hypothetical protein K5986_11280 [Clostridium sp.]|uniref:hypothetical protein n=1 Tax=Clostridium sp. DSM 8431 TaxID=1761781 RepID=UPI0008EBB2BC|nr:hypothetical protein [Clostridium sp. DSM 8431]MCR4944997.1 hypothetical protein [Clostridium sp.]SFU32068.1 hypothetical protein SAMN04487886_100636 [Clostridium sp. DSM 8431]